MTKRQFPLAASLAAAALLAFLATAAARPGVEPGGDPAAPSEPPSTLPPAAPPPTLPPAAPPPAAPAAEPAHDPATYKEWYYVPAGEGAQPAGPFTIAAMREEVTKGAVGPLTQTYVERNGWRPARNHPELADLFPEAPPPPPPPPPAAPPPPPTGPSQGELDARMTTYFIGSWRSDQTVTSPDGASTFRVLMEIAYLPRGALRGVSTWSSLDGSYTSTMSLEGSYTLKATAETLFILSTEITANGGKPDKGSGTFRIVDQNTIENTATGHRAVRIQ